MVNESIQLSDEQIVRFQTDGFLVINDLVDLALAQRVADRIEPMFNGQFETGIYPDEWYWRPGLSLPDATREICNAWKCDLTIASVALSAEVGRLTALLAGWPGARIGQDSLWMKPPGAREIALHQDATYISYIDPPEMMTCWIALDDTTADIGTIEYARGSHQWKLMTQLGEFFSPTTHYHSAMKRAAEEAGVEPEIVPIEISAGSCVIHHGKTWHGSGMNKTDRPRRSLAVHTLSSEATFQPTGAGYIYGRYKRVGDTTMDENFFPILWTREGYRTPFLADYCDDGLLGDRTPVTLSV